MKKCEFSERLFETLVNYEFMNLKGYDIYIPSQIKEAKTGLDAVFNNGKKKAYLLQYKVAHYYDLYPSNLIKPSYGFKIYKSKHNGYNQHNKICEKVSKKLNCGYLVPLFHTYNDLYSHYHKKDLHNNVVLIKTQKKINDSKTHHIFFTKTQALQCSKAEELNVINLENLFIDVKYMSYDEFEDELLKGENISCDKKIEVEAMLNKMNAIVVLKD